jgi:hypothetical protein
MTSPQGALTGIRVLDISRILGGPYCGQILGDHGADVLKVEPPQGDDTRTWGPPFKEGVASYYHGLNRNKRVQHLDFATEEGREALLALVAEADVLIENFKTGTMERWGIGYETLSRRFPRLVWCRVSGFGADGPLGALPGYDAAVQAMTGIMSINGEADGGPLRVGLPVVDMVTGLNAVIGVLLSTTVASRCCIHTRPTGSWMARRRAARAMRTPTSTPTTRWPRAPTRCSWPWATTGSSQACAAASDCPIWPTIRSTARPARARCTATDSSSGSKRQWPPSTGVHWSTG